MSDSLSCSILLNIALLFFFFSSRRRHTRWTGDWSSDVCSSDLLLLGQADLDTDGGARAILGQLPDDLDVGDLAGDRDPLVRLVYPQLLRHREVRVARRPQRELAGRAGPHRLDARTPLREPGRVEQQLPDLLD